MNPLLLGLLVLLGYASVSASPTKLLPVPALHERLAHHRRILGELKKHESTLTELRTALSNKSLPDRKRVEKSLARLEVNVRQARRDLGELNGAQPEAAWKRDERRLQRKLDSLRAGLQKLQTKRAE